MLRKNKNLFLCLIVMLLWGSLFPTVKLGMKAFSVSTVGDILLFAGVRFTVCGAIICLISFFKDRGSYADAKKSILPIMLAGFFAIILHYACTYSALNVADSSKTAILKQVGALFYVSFSFLFFKDDKVSVKKLAGAILGFLGIVAINSGVGGVSFNIGDALIICASFASVFANIVTKKVTARVAPITVTGISQLFGGVVLLLAGVFLGGKMSLPQNSSALVLVYICAASCVSYCIWYAVVKKGELSRLFIIKFAEPLFACIFGALLLGENIFQWQYLLSFLLISLGIVITNK